MKHEVRVKVHYMTSQPKEVIEEIVRKAIGEYTNREEEPMVCDEVRVVKTVGDMEEL